MPGCPLLRVVWIHWILFGAECVVHNAWLEGIQVCSLNFFHDVPAYGCHDDSRWLYGCILRCDVRRIMTTGKEHQLCCSYCQGGRWLWIAILSRIWLFVNWVAFAPLMYLRILWSVITWNGWSEPSSQWHHSSNAAFMESFEHQSAFHRRNRPTASIQGMGPLSRSWNFQNVTIESFCNTGSTE